MLRYAWARVTPHCSANLKSMEYDMPPHRPRNTHIHRYMPLNGVPPSPANAMIAHPSPKQTANTMKNTLIENRMSAI